MPGKYSARDIATMGDEEFYDLAALVNSEQDRRRFLREAKGEVDQRIDLYMQFASEEAKPLKSLAEGAAIGPGERISVDGVVYVNVARAWLNPFKAGPANFIAGWEKIEKKEEQDG